MNYRVSFKMSGSCNDCGNVMCLCDSEGDDFEGVLSSGIIISNERYEKLIEEIQKRDELLAQAKIIIDSHQAVTLNPFKWDSCAQWLKQYEELK